MGGRVSRYPKYTTTVVGAHSVPDWYEPLDRLLAVGQPSMAALADAQHRCTEAAVLEQELADIDVITGGEMHRRTHNRHSPPNAMLNFFWQKIPAFQGATRPKPITKKDPDVFHPAATCKDRILDSIDLGLVEEFKTVSALTRRPVKITMTGPHMLASVAYDEYYNNIDKMMLDLAKLLRRNFRMLVDAGCRNIQIDEHYCQGNYAVGKEYDGQIGHRYFDTGRYKADIVCKIACSSILIEHDMTHHYEGQLHDQQLGIGAVDVQDPKVETPQQVADRIQLYRWLAPEQKVITSSCGFNHLPRKTVIGKLGAMTAAKRLLGG